MDSVSTCSQVHHSISKVRKSDKKRDELLYSSDQVNLLLLLLYFFFEPSSRLRRAEGEIIITFTFTIYATRSPLLSRDESMFVNEAYIEIVTRRIEIKCTGTWRLQVELSRTDYCQKWYWKWHQRRQMSAIDRRWGPSLQLLKLWRFFELNFFIKQFHQTKHWLMLNVLQ